MFAAILLIIILNSCYLVGLYRLMNMIKSNVEYWTFLGRPNSFSGPHVSAMLSNMYKHEMSSVCSSIGAYRLLLFVRIMLPIAFLFSLASIIYISKTLN